MRFKLEDLPDKYRQQIERQLNVAPRTQEVKEITMPSEPKARRSKTPNKTELDYRHQVLDPQFVAGALLSIAYEALTFRMANGHRYTPDWVCRQATGRLVCIEVKGSYRLGSYQRARLAFDQVRTEWPNIIWRWAERDKDGSWRQT